MLNSINNQSNAMIVFMQQRMEATFKNSDGDGDGMLNESEFNTFMNSLAGQSGTAHNTEALFANADTDSDGLLSIEEIEAARPEPPSEPHNVGKSDLAAAQRRFEMNFANADEDGDGMLTETEFETLIANLPAPPNEVEGSEQDTATMFADADTDGDGLLSLTEVQVAAPQGPPPPGGGMAMESSEQTTLEDFLTSATEDEETTSTVFSYLDTNKDGVVDIDEILAAFSQNVTEMYNLIQQSRTVSGNDLDISA